MQPGIEPKFAAEALQERSQVTLRVFGASMLPWLRAGDVAVVRRTSLSCVQRGDIVLFYKADRLFMHRIVGRRSSAGLTVFVAKGDANPHIDGIVEPQEVLGRVEQIYRGSRRIEFHSPRKRALSFLIAEISRYSGLWFLLVHVRGSVKRRGRRLLEALRPPGALAR